jgi:hypothetical protein
MECEVREKCVTKLLRRAGPIRSILESATGERLTGKRLTGEK